MIIFQENPWKSAEKLNVNWNYIKVKKYKKSIPFLHAKNNQVDNIMKTDPIFNTNKSKYN